MARSKYEIKAHRQLEAEGYEVDYKARPFRVPKGYQVDFLGCFDLLAYRPRESLRWISIKGHAGVPRAHREQLSLLILPKCCIKEIWIYRPNGTVKKEVIP